VNQWVTGVGRLACRKRNETETLTDRIEVRGGRRVNLQAVADIGLPARQSPGDTDGEPHGTGFLEPCLLLTAAIGGRGEIDHCGALSFTRIMRCLRAVLPHY
jgi:hypothetical protein